MASSSFWDKIQLAGDVLGMVPLVGNFVDLANAGVSVLRGDAAGAALRGAAAIPGVGLGVGGVKLAKTGATAAKQAGNVKKAGAAKQANTKAEQIEAARKAGASEKQLEILRKRGEKPTTALSIPNTDLTKTTNLSTRVAGKAGKAADEAAPLTKRQAIKNIFSQYRTRRPLARTSAAAMTAASLAAGEEGDEGTTIDMKALKKADKKALKEFLEGRQSDRDALKEKSLDALKDYEKPEGVDKERAGLRGDLNELRFKLSEAQDDKKEFESDRRTQLGDRIRNMMTTPGSADPDYWKKNPDKLRAIIREGKNLGESSFTAEDARDIIKENYKQAQRQQRDDEFEADSAKGMQFTQSGIVTDNVSKALQSQRRRDGGRQVNPLDMRAYLDMMAGKNIEKGYQGPKERAPEADITFDDQSQAIKDQISAKEKGLEDLDIKEGEAFYDWVEGDISGRKQLKKDLKDFDKETEEDRKKKKKEARKIREGKQKAWWDANAMDTRPRSLRTIIKEEIGDPVLGTIQKGADKVLGFGEYR